MKKTMFAALLLGVLAIAHVIGRGFKRLVFRPRKA